MKLQQYITESADSKVDNAVKLLKKTIYQTVDKTYKITKVLGNECPKELLAVHDLIEDALTKLENYEKLLRNK